MFSNTNTDERVNNINIAVNAVIKRELAAQTMSDADVNIVGDMLIQIRTDTAHLNTLSNFSTLSGFECSLGFKC